MLITVVEHQRKYGGQQLVGAQLFFFDELLIEQSNVGQDADRHPLVLGGLEFQQYAEVDDFLTVLHLHSIDHVTFTPFQVIGMEFGVDSLQGGEIQVRHPILGDKMLE